MKISFPKYPSLISVFVLCLAFVSCEKEEHYSLFSKCNCAPNQMVYNRNIDIDLINWPLELSDYGSKMVRDSISTIQVKEACRLNEGTYCIRKIANITETN